MIGALVTGAGAMVYGWLPQWSMVTGDGLMALDHWRLVDDVGAAKLVLCLFQEPCHFP